MVQNGTVFLSDPHIANTMKKPVLVIVVPVLTFTLWKIYYECIFPKWWICYYYNSAYKQTKLLRYIMALPNGRHGGLFIAGTS